jgi:hypothetical protein
MPALLLTFLPYLFQAAKAVPQVMDYIHKTREHLQQTGEWTQEMEDSFTKELQDLQSNPPDWWKPETK